MQRQHKQRINHVLKDNDILGRARKQELQRESFETRLMGFEDYVNTSEGMDRLNRFYEHVTMETEDEVSRQVEAMEREKKVLSIKDQVRLEVEARLAQEKREKEAKRLAAEQRRAAVVERLRLQAEAEERRRIEAELQLQLIKEEQLRSEQLAVERWLTNQRLMSREDEWSRLIELEYREQLRVQQEILAEKMRLVQLEAELKAREEDQARLRKLRMKELEEKKAKLLLLKQQQVSVGSNEQQLQLMRATKEESDRLNKQLRIQNRAKFVTKRLAAAEEEEPQSDASKLDDLPAGDGGVVQRGSTSGGALMSDGALRHDATNAARISNQELEHATTLTTTADADATSAAPVVVSPLMLHQDTAGSCSRDDSGTVSYSSSTMTKPKQTKPMSAMEIEYLQLLNSIDSESSLKQLQRELMMEKRALRLEQKQRLSNVRSSNQQDEETVKLAKELRQRIDDVTKKEKLLETRITDLMHHSMNTAGSEEIKEATTDGEEEGVIMDKKPAVTRQASFAALTRQPSTRIPVDVVSTQASMRMYPLTEQASIRLDNAASSPTKAVAVTHLSSSSTMIESQVRFHKAEQLIRDANELINSMFKAVGSNCIGNSTSEPEDRRTMLDSKVTLIAMEMSQLIKAIAKDIDPINYCERLAQVSSSMREAFNSYCEKDLQASIAVSSEMSSADHPSALVVSSADHPSVSVVSSADIGEYIMTNTKPLPNDQTDEREANTGEAARSTNEAFSALSIVTDGIDAPPDDVTTRASADDDDDSSSLEIDMDGFDRIPGWDECLNTSMASAAHHAAFYGHTEVLSCLCRYFDCFVMDKKGRTPLFYAALQNRLECVAMLVELDAQWIDVGDEKGDTSLHAAAIADGVDVLDFLVSCEAQVDTANYMGLTPSHLARSRKALQCLFKAGAQLYCVDNNSRMPLWFACAEGRSDCVDYLCGVTPSEYLLWPDEEGETSLHKAAMNGHASCVEVLCQHLPGIEDLYTPNKKQFTAAHVASNVEVLKALYENGANIWVTESKERTPLFMASFFGRIDTVFFLLDLANSTNNLSKVDSADIHGDTALHAACLCGHVQCVSLLLYFIRSRSNKQGLTPDQLALRAGHKHITALVSFIEDKRRGQEGMGMDEIFGCDFNLLSSVVTYYGSRWCKYYDLAYDSFYYYDRVTGTSQWERPYDFDMSGRDENKWEQACATLLQFYRLYNPERVRDLNEILVAYRDRYTELFLTLAEKYRVTDLSMFKGIDLD